MSAIGYKITNTINGMCYFGIVYGKNPNIHQRFKKHMMGKGGVYLYNFGVCRYGAGVFIIEEIIRGELKDVRDWEHGECIKHLWPNGYNGNAGKAILKTTESEKKRLNSFHKTVDNKTKEQINSSNEKRKLTNLQKSEDQISEIKKKLSNASKKFWNSMTEEEKQEFISKRSKNKSKAYNKKTEQEKNNIRIKIKTSMCKRQYKSPFGIFISTVDGGRAEGISSALFNYRCKSSTYPEYEILST